MVLLLLAGLAGCGARGFVLEDELIDVAGGSGGGGSGGGGALGGSGGSGAGGSAGGTDSVAPFSFVTMTLGTCELGPPWRAGDGRSCSFRFNGRCYDDEDAVCACACPRDSNSVCVLSGFLSDPSNPLMVTCQKG